VTRRPIAVFAAVLTLTLIVDQVTKAAVRAWMGPVGTSIALLGDLLRLTYVRNPGAAFGMLPQQRGVFVAVSFLVILGIGLYIYKMRPTRSVVVVALGFVCGGALGNLIDRLAFGKVTDFIEVRHIPVFNAADSAISIGVAMLVLWLLFSPSEMAGEHVGGALEHESRPDPAEDETGDVPPGAGAGRVVREEG
jgi:signal peptidase II